MDDVVVNPFMRARAPPLPLLAPPPVPFVVDSEPRVSDVNKRHRYKMEGEKTKNFLRFFLLSDTNGFFFL